MLRDGLKILLKSLPFLHVTLHAQVALYCSPYSFHYLVAASVLPEVVRNPANLGTTVVGEGGKGADSSNSSYKQSDPIGAHMEL